MTKIISPLKDYLQSKIDLGEITSRTELLQIASEQGWRVTRNGTDYITMQPPDANRFRLRFNFCHNNATNFNQSTKQDLAFQMPPVRSTIQKRKRIYSVYAFLAINENQCKACYIGVTVDLNRRFKEHTTRKQKDRASSNFFAWVEENDAQIFYATLASVLCTQSDSLKHESHWVKLALDAGYEAPGIKRWMPNPKRWAKSGQPELWSEGKLILQPFQLENER
jgi:GIY-YIG catalytic domain